MDREMQISEALETEAEEPKDRAQRSFLLERSERRVQAITVLMLHCCAGLQHVQDTEVRTVVSTILPARVYMKSSRSYTFKENTAT